MHLIQSLTTSCTSLVYHVPSSHVTTKVVSLSRMILLPVFHILLLFLHLLDSSVWLTRFLLMKQWTFVPDMTQIITVVMT